MFKCSRNRHGKTYLYSPLKEKPTPYLSLSGIPPGVLRSFSTDFPTGRGLCDHGSSLVNPPFLTHSFSRDRCSVQTDITRGTVFTATESERVFILTSFIDLYKILQFFWFSLPSILFYVLELYPKCVSRFTCGDHNRNM